MTLLDSTLGTLLIGVFVSMVLFGITCAQCIFYFLRYPDDSFFTKTVIAAIWAADVVVTALDAYFIYHELVTDFGNYLALATQPMWSASVPMIVDPFVIMPIQTLYCIRVWRFAGGEKIIPAIVTLSLIASLVLGILGTIEVILRPFNMNFTPVLPSIYGVNAGFIVFDVVCAAALCYYLRRGQTEFPHAQSLVATLTLWIVGTGALTAAFTLPTLIVFSVKKDMSLYMALYMVIFKLYVNGFLAMHNMRRTFRKKRSSLAIVSISCSESIVNASLEPEKDEMHSDRESLC